MVKPPEINNFNKQFLYKQKLIVIYHTLYSLVNPQTSECIHVMSVLNNLIDKTVGYCLEEDAATVVVEAHTVVL